MINTRACRIKFCRAQSVYDIGRRVACTGRTLEGAVIDRRARWEGILRAAKRIDICPDRGSSGVWWPWLGAVISGPHSSLHLPSPPAAAQGRLRQHTSTVYCAQRQAAERGKISRPSLTSAPGTPKPRYRPQGTPALSSAPVRPLSTGVSACARLGPVLPAGLRKPPGPRCCPLSSHHSLPTDLRTGSWNHHACLKQTERSLRSCPAILDCRSAILCDPSHLQQSPVRPREPSVWNASRFPASSPLSPQTLPSC